MGRVFKMFSHSITLLLIVWLMPVFAAVTPPKPSANPELVAHQQKFIPARLEKVSDRVYFAMGYSWSNIIFVEGNDGIIVIDCGLYKESADKAMADFRKICDKPVRAVIYTHNHGDHLGGARAFIPEGKESDVEIIASNRWSLNNEKYAGPTGPTNALRGAMQIGLCLREGIEGKISGGVGPVVNEGTFTYVPPNRFVDGELELMVAGVRLKCFDAPADANAHIGVFLPDEKVMCTGDALTGVLPPVATIREERGRNSMDFVRSIDKMMQYPVEHMLPGHGPRVSGKENVHRVFLNTRDFAQYIHDQTIRMMNMGRTPGEIVEIFRLPEHLAKEPELGEYYHRLGWMIRGIFMKNAGWWSGDTVDMVKPLHTAEAERMVALVGKEKLLKAAEQSYKEGDYGWAAQLATYLIRAFPEDTQFKQLKVHSLRSIAYASKSSNERNYLLTHALALEGAELMSVFGRGTAEKWAKRSSINTLLENMGAKLNPDKCGDKVIAVNFRFSDLREDHSLTVRRGVSVHKPTPVENAVAVVTLPEKTMRDLIAGRLIWQDALDGGAIRVSGSRKQCEALLGYYDLL